MAPYAPLVAIANSVGSIYINPGVKVEHPLCSLPLGILYIYQLGSVSCGGCMHEF